MGWANNSEEDETMAYLCIDLLSFPNKEIEEKFEEECKQWLFDGRVIFIGRMARDPLGKYTHAMVWKYDDNDFSGVRKALQEYADTLETSSEPIGDFAAYKFEHWYGFRVAALDDPIVKKHGIDEWTKREADHSVRPPASDFKNPARVAQWFEALNKKLQKNWPVEALKKSHWVAKLSDQGGGR